MFLLWWTVRFQSLGPSIICASQSVSVRSSTSNKRNRVVDACVGHETGSSIAHPRVRRRHIGALIIWCSLVAFSCLQPQLWHHHHRHGYQHWHGHCWRRRQLFSFCRAITLEYRFWYFKQSPLNIEFGACNAGFYFKNIVEHKTSLGQQHPVLC